MSPPASREAEEGGEECHSIVLMAASQPFAVVELESSSQTLSRILIVLVDFCRIVDEGVRSDEPLDAWFALW